MKPTILIAMLATGAALAACSPKSEGQNTASTAPSADASSTTAATNMAGMAMPEAKMAKGTGTVTAVDTAAGTITLDHSAIPEAGWPAMVMAFKATPDMIAQVKTGDKVDFELQLHGGGGELTAIRKAPN